MGQDQSKQPWQQDYTPISSLNSNPLHLQHKNTHQQCQLLTLSITPQQRSRYMERINKRVGQRQPQYLTTLSKWRIAGGETVCGNKQRLELLFGKVSPTLEEVVRHRKDGNQQFTAEQIVYIIKGVAYGLKDVQNMGEEHGRVQLSTISITNEVNLSDPLLLDAEERIITKHRNSNQIYGYPSPQKLKSFYDSLTSFEELRGDLFSLGMVALQLVYLDQDVSVVYSNPNPSYRNYTIDFERLNRMIDSILDQRVRQAVSILTSMDSKKRIEIYELLRNVPIDDNRVKLMNPEERYGKNQSYPKIQQLPQDKYRTDFVVEKSRQDRGKVGTQTYEPRPLEPNRDIDSYRHEHFHYYSAMNASPPPLQPHQISPPVAPTPGISFSSQPPSSSIPAALSSTLPGLTSQPTTHSKPIVAFNHGHAPEVSTSQMHQSHMISVPRDSHYSKLGTVSYIQSIPVRAEGKEVSRDYVQYSAYTSNKVENSSNSSTGNIPSFQDILNKIKGNTPANTGQIGSPISHLEQNKYFQSARETSSKQRQLKIEQGVTTSQLPSGGTYVSRSVDAKGAESIYQDETKNETEIEAKSNKPQSSDKAGGEGGFSEKGQEEQPNFKKSQVKFTERQAQKNQKGQQITSKAEDKQQIRESMKDPINGATSVVSAVPEAHEQREEPYYKQEQVIKEAITRNKDSSQYNSSPMKSDPKIVVVEPLQMQAASPLRKGPVYVEETYDIGTRYEGYMLNGMRDGKGKFFYKEGSYYDGQWLKNKMHGYGVLYYPNGMVAYEGQWKEDEFDGKGIVYNDQQRQIGGSFDFTDFNQLDDEWVRYEGDLRSDAKDGNGKLILTNGQVYEGEFSRDMVHGVGFFRSGSSEKKGVWQNGKLKKLLDVA